MDNSTFRRWANKITVDKDGCWIWTGAKRAGGYGGIYLDERSVSVHRLTHEHFIGPIPKGMIIEHRCRKKACCNPWCTEPTTRRANMIRYYRMQRDNSEF